MRKQVFLIVFCLSLACVHAETLVLHTGVRVQGSVVFQNEEVVVIRDAEGARFQYPRADVAEILSDDPANDPTANKPTNNPTENDQTVNKKASILLELAGGAAVVPGETAGGAFCADLLVGSHHIGSRHIFAGAGLGFHGVFLSTNPNQPQTTSNTLNQPLSFLPVQAAVRVPLIEEKHAPVFGLALGYGIALSREYLGGLYAGVDFGYRCRLNPKTALSLVAFVQFQQAVVPVSTVLDDNTYTQKSGRNIVSSGLKMALYF